MTAATAWPFLIARGRRRGYTVLAAPAFLVRDGAEGFLEEVVGPPSDPVATREVVGPRDRPLCLVWAAHRLRGDDIGEPDDPVDEHSRPLRLLHGFVCPDAVVTDPNPADLDRTLDAALATYRRFLRDEEAFTAEESAAFPVTARSVAPAAERTRPMRTRGLLVAAGLIATLLLGLWVTTGAGDEPPSEPVVTLGETVHGTIETADEQDSYLLDTGTATHVALRDAQPARITVRLRGAPDDGDGCWTVTANTRYRVTVTSATGAYTFRLVSSPRPCGPT
ncbi:hypothetical protein [Actinophytocola sp.]|uniref:hypothetical protein n=1 Tax=Actinophytocola sp. TaxID=1872138 RepID=UPI002ED2D618